MTAKSKARYWLMKSEPDAFSIDDLQRLGRSHWDGVRNYQARNFMRDDMSIGDPVLFYHSSCAIPGVVGLAEVSGEAIPDHDAWDSKSKYFDPKSDPESPRWFMVEVRFVQKFPRIVALSEIKDDPALVGMRVAMRGQRLSIQPVESKHYRHILKIAKR